MPSQCSLNRTHDVTRMQRIHCLMVVLSFNVCKYMKCYMLLVLSTKLAIKSYKDPMHSSQTANKMSLGETLRGTSDGDGVTSPIVPFSNGTVHTTDKVLYILLYL